MTEPPPKRPAGLLSLMVGAELPLLLAMGALVLWLARPEVWLAVLSAALAAFSLVGGFRIHRRARLIVEAAIVTGALVAVSSSVKIRSVEVNWADQRESLVTRASTVLDDRLAEALSLAERLSNDVAATAEASRSEAFDLLAADVDRVSTEVGVVRFGVNGRPWAWGGRFRLEPELFEGVRARVTPFYAVLESGVNAGGTRAAAQVLLWADSSLPGVGETTASDFGTETGSDLKFFSPEDAPNVTDVFDYCIPDCRPATGSADTLFSVRALPPSQGAVKLQLLSGGGAKVTWALLFATVAAMLFGPIRIKRFTVAGAAIAAIFTRAPEYIGMAGFFSAETFFVGGLGPLSDSAGSLTLTSTMAVIAAVGLWRLGLKRNVFTFAGSVLLVAAAPYALRIVAHGITPTGGSESVAMWVGWELVVTVTSSAFMLFAAAIVRGADSESPRWMSLLAAGWAIGVAIVGLVLWNPGPGAAWPEWYTFLWIPALLLAVQPGPTTRMVPTIAIVAGSAAALLTWGATVEGRMVLADRDVDALGETGDIVVISALDDLGARLADGPPPATVSDLYLAWSGSGLRAGRYPVSMVTRDRRGREVARFDLADLDVTENELAEVVAAARAADAPVIDDVPLLLGRHSVLAVPYDDGSMVIAKVAPRSKLIRVSGAGLLFGIGGRDLPFDVALSTDDRFAELPGEGVRWARDGWSVVGTRRLLYSGEERAVIAEVSLLTPGRLIVRGALVVLFDVLAILMLWLAGEVLADRVELIPRLGRSFRGSRYRTRLALALAAFFVIPTLGFTGWTMLRLRAETVNRQDLLLVQELADLSEGLVRDAAGSYRTGVSETALRFRADLSLYDGGAIVAASNQALEGLGLVEPLVPYEAFGPVVLGGADYAVVHRDRESLITAFRDLPDRGSFVLGLAGTPPGSGTRAPQEDVLYTVILVSILGLAAATWLATLTARSMTRPLQALRDAAAAVGMGQPARPVMRPVPAELDPVIEAFERMESDVLEHQSALESTVSFTQAVLRHVATGVVALDRGLRVAAANPRAENLLQATLASGTRVAGQTSERWGDVWQWVEAFVAGGRDSNVQEFTVDDRRVKVLAAVLEGPEAGCVVVLDDVTDLTRAERVLAWGEMARQVAHEIKNPLTPIRLGIQYLQRAHRDGREDFGPMLDRTSEQILAEIERLDSIARGFSRFGSPGGESTPIEAVDLAVVARDTAALYNMGSDCEITVTGGAVSALARQDEFKELLVNLIENSRDAEAGLVAITITGAGGKARIEVADNGKGIPQDVLPRIFEPKFSTTTSGTGLGLAISKRLVDSWDGNIEVRSAAGEGTTVAIELRRAGDDIAADP